MPPLFRALIVGALLGATIGFAAAQLLPTSHSAAMAKAAALAPDGSDAPPTGELDFPFWYGGRYQAVQTFTGGARDRSHLTEVMTRRLDREGWQIVGINERPGATVITAVQDDLEVRVHARAIPFPTVEGVIQVMYRYEPPTGVLLLVGALSGVAATLTSQVVWSDRKAIAASARVAHSVPVSRPSARRVRARAAGHGRSGVVEPVSGVASG